MNNTSAYIYILSNRNRTVLYIGVTNDLERRVLEHKLKTGSKFTSKYQLNHLMYYEEYGSITDSIYREKQLKNWHREWKWSLIKEKNPELKDLAEEWYEDEL